MPLDDIIVQDIHKWKQAIVDSGYSSLRLLTQTLTMLLGSTKEDVLTALNIFSNIKIGTNLKQKILTIITQEKVKSFDLAIAEAAVTFLGNEVMFEGVKEALLGILKQDTRINIKIAAISALKNTLDPEVLTVIIELLSTTDRWIFTAVLDSLKDFYIFSDPEVRKSIINALLGKLADKPNEDNFFLQETITLLQELRYSQTYIIETLTKELQICKTDQRLEVIVDTLQNLLFQSASTTMQMNVAQILVDKLEALRIRSISDLVSGEKHYVIRAKLKKILADLLVADSQHILQDKIYLLTKSSISSTNELLATTAAEALTKIYLHIPSNRAEIFSILINNIDNSRHLQSKIASIEALNSVFERLTSKQQNILVQKLIALSPNDRDALLIASCYKLLKAISLLQYSIDLDGLASKVLTFLDKASNIDILEISYELLASLFIHTSQSIQITIFSVFKFQIQNPKVSGEQQKLIKILSSMYDLLNTTQKSEIVKIFQSLAERASFVESIETLETAIAKIQDSPEAGIQNLFLHHKTPRLDVFMDNFQFINRVIDELIVKYSSLSMATTTEDQFIINSLFEHILITILDTENPIIQQRMLSIINRAEYITSQLISSLGKYSDQLEREEKLQKLTTIFSDNTLLQSELSIVMPKPITAEDYLIKRYSTIEVITENIDSFVTDVLENNVEIILGRESITFNDKEYLRINEIGPDLYLDYVQIIYNAFIISGNKLIKVHVCNLHGIFDPLDQMPLGPGDTKLTILRQVSLLQPDASSTNIFLIIEYKTIFADILTRKISLNSHDSSLIYSSLDVGYKKGMLGEHAEHIGYLAKSIFITRAEFFALIESSKTWTTSLDLLKGTISLLKEVHTDVDVPGTLVSHNTLIGLQEFEERIKLLESKFDGLSRTFVTEINQLKLDQTSSKKMLTDMISFVRATDDIELPPNLSLYKKTLFLEIVHGLNALHMSAMVVQTSMVANNQKGVAGNIAWLLEKIGPHIPIAGIAVELLGLTLDSLDAKMQDILSRKIASLAIDSVEMSKLSKAFGLLIIRNGISPDNLREFTHSVSFKLTEFAPNIDLNLLRKVIDCAETSLSAETEVTKAQKDAEDIIGLITSYLITTKEIPLTTNWFNNYKLLEDFLNDNSVLLPALTPLDLLRRSSDEFDPETSEFREIRIASSLLSARSSEGKLFESLKLEENEGKNTAPDIKGALVANIVEAVPSTKYLLTEYIPLGKYIQDWSIVRAFSSYEHYFYSLIHSGANLYHVLKNPQDWQFSLMSSGAFIAKPFVYEYRDQLLSYLKGAPYEESIKLAAYIATDTGLSFIENAVFLGVTPAALGYALLKGSATGSINYYNSKEHPDSNLFSSSIANGATTATLYVCYKHVQSIENSGDQLLAIPLLCIPAAASTHIYTKWACS